MVVIWYDNPKKLYVFQLITQSCSRYDWIIYVKLLHTFRKCPVRPGRWHSIGAHVKPLKMFFQSVELAQYGNNACGICGTVFLKAWMYGSFIVKGWISCLMKRDTLLTLRNSRLTTALGEGVHNTASMEITYINSLGPRALSVNWNHMMVDEFQQDLGWEVRGIAWGTSQEQSIVKVQQETFN